MQLTVKEYCDKVGKEPRYLQKIIKEDKRDLLRANWGIEYYKKFGNTYLLTVNEDFLKKF